MVGLASDFGETMSTTIRLVIIDGYLSFDPDGCEDVDLRSWLENTGPEDLMDGVWTFDVEVDVAGWGDDGPILYAPKDET